MTQKFMIQYAYNLDSYYTDQTTVEVERGNEAEQIAFEYYLKRNDVTSYEIYTVNHDDSYELVVRHICKGY